MKLAKKQLPKWKVICLTTELSEVIRHGILNVSNR